MYMIRLLIVGESSVGKTSLLIRFHEGNFYKAQRTTIGVDYKAKEIAIDEETVKLQVLFVITLSDNSIFYILYIAIYKI